MQYTILYYIHNVWSNKTKWEASDFIPSWKMVGHDLPKQQIGRDMPEVFTERRVYLFNRCLSQSNDSTTAYVPISGALQKQWIWKQWIKACISGWLNFDKFICTQVKMSQHVPKVITTASQMSAQTWFGRVLQHFHGSTYRVPQNKRSLVLKVVTWGLQQLLTLFCLVVIQKAELWQPTFI